MLRKGEKKTISLTLGEVPEDVGKLSRTETREGILGGLSLVPLGPALRDKYGIPSRVRRGVVVTQIQPGSRAHHAVLQPGDVILEINHREVNSVAAFEKAYRSSGERLLLLVYRQGTTICLVLSK